MATRKAKRAQGSAAITDKPAVPDISDSEIDVWSRQHTLQRIEELARIVAVMHEAASAGNVDKLKELARKNGGMLRRLARVALAAIAQGDERARTYSSGYALEKLFTFTGSHRDSLDLFIRRATGALKPEAPRPEPPQFNREDRKAERYEIVEVLFDDFSTNKQLMVDCMFACITASRKRLAEIMALLAEPDQQASQDE